jgi:O-antigen ligase
VIGGVTVPRVEVLALCVVVLTLPFHLFAWGVGGQSVSPTEAAILLTAVLVGARFVARRWPLTPRLPLPCAGEGESTSSRRDTTATEEGFAAFDGPIILFLAGALLSLLATEYLRLSFRELRTLIVEPVLFWYLCRAVLRSREDVGWLVGTLVTVTSLVAVLGLVQFVRGGAVTDVQGVRRVLGPYTSPNHFALLLGRALPFLLTVGWCLPRWRPWAAIGAVLCGGALLATFSVGGWLGTALAVLVVVGLLGGRRVVLGLALAGAVAAAVVFFAIPVERLTSRIDPTQGTSFARVQLWRAGIELVRQSPLLGIGLDNFLYRYPTMLPPDAPFEPNLSHPHNLILQFWLSLGLPGLVALGWLLWRFARPTWRAAVERSGAALSETVGQIGRIEATTTSATRALAVGALGSMTDFVAHGLVDNSYFLPDMAVIFWLTVAVAAVLKRRSA